MVNKRPVTLRLILDPWSPIRPSALPLLLSHRSLGTRDRSGWGRSPTRSRSIRDRPGPSANAWARYPRAQALLAGLAQVAGEVVAEQRLVGVDGQCLFQTLNGQIEPARALVAPSQRDAKADILRRQSGGARSKGTRASNGRSSARRASPHKTKRLNVEIARGPSRLQVSKVCLGMPVPSSPRPRDESSCGGFGLRRSSPVAPEKLPILPPYCNRRSDESQNAGRAAVVVSG